MSEEDQKKTETETETKTKTPHRISRVAFPKAKFGVYLALVIIILILIILYKDLIL